MKEKSKWFYSKDPSATKAVVLLAHGLNLKPEKMNELAVFFTSRNCDVLRIVLGEDPKRWTEKFSDDYDAALEQAVVLERPLFFVGYSLGALLGMHFAVTHPHHKIKKWALFAPAIRSHFYALMPALLGHLLPKGKLPSLNLKNYRQRDFTTLLEYKIMHGLQKIIKTNSFSIPTLVFLNPNDELVSSAQVAFFAHQNKEWKVVEISNFESQLPRKYHHLMIDLECLGKAMWGKVLKNLTEHFLI